MTASPSSGSSAKEGNRRAARARTQAPDRPPGAPTGTRSGSGPPGAPGAAAARPARSPRRPATLRSWGHRLGPLAGAGSPRRSAAQGSSPLVGGAGPRRSVRARCTLQGPAGARTSGGRSGVRGGRAWWCGCSSARAGSHPRPRAVRGRRDGAGARPRGAITGTARRTTRRTPLLGFAAARAGAGSGRRAPCQSDGPNLGKDDTSTGSSARVVARGWWCGRPASPRRSPRAAPGSCGGSPPSARPWGAWGPW